MWYVLLVNLPKALDGVREFFVQTQRGGLVHFDADRPLSAGRTTLVYFFINVLYKR